MTRCYGLLARNHSTLQHRRGLSLSIPERTMPRQPPIELAVGAPLQVDDEGDETVVGIRTRDGWQELKRIPNRE